MTITGSTAEAMALLQAYRAAQIEDAREVACELIEKYGFTTSKQVQEIMAERDLIDVTLGNFWYGAVFNSSQFKWTGEWEFPAGNPATHKNKAHDWRPMKIWTFNDKHYDFSWPRHNKPARDA